MKVSKELTDKIVEGILAGKPLQVIAEEIGGFHPSAIGRWAMDDPLFRESLRSARAESAHMLVDEAIRIADTATDPKRARNQMHARQFAAERRNRQAYGPTMDLQIEQRVDLGGTLIEARKRLLLPGSNLAQIPQAQDVDYVTIPAPSATDKQSAAPALPLIDPFAE